MANSIHKKEESTLLWWVAFVITTLITLVMLKYMSEWFWLALPFSITALVKAFKVI